MAKTTSELRAQLSEIEPTSAMFDGLAPDDVDQLRSLVASEEPWMAARAVHALARIGNERSADAVLAAVRDPRIAVRVAAASSSATLPAAQADQVLLALLDDEAPSVRKIAVRSVTASNGAAVLQRVRALSTNAADPHVRRAATAAVGVLGPDGGD